MLKTGSRIGILALLFLVAVSFYQRSLPIQRHLNNVANAVSVKMPGQSKAEIVSELKAIKERIEHFEEINGLSGTNGYKVYSAAETGNLIRYYKELRTGLDYLNQGEILAVKDWEGYVLEDQGRAAYGNKEAVQILAELDEEKLPPAFLADFRVYLLPSGPPEVSGLGGAGFAMISAPDIKEKSIEGLRVTLLHELGHHLHASFMPSINGRPNPLWEAYHEIRGGEWRGPGKVNTLDWSSSSEETFAEDFRMLFGKDQWYYGDIDLGDPREQPEVAGKLKQFMIGLKGQKAPKAHRSPWVPEGLGFWLECQSYIYIGWAVMIMGLSIVSTIINQKKARIRDEVVHCFDSSEVTGY